MPHLPSAPADDLDVAVIGIGCRLPDAETPQQYWTNLASGVESIRRLSREELEQAGVPRSDYTDAAYVPAAAGLRDIDLFDAEFFGYSRKEAETLDPQVRVFLECAWESFEDAGCDPLSQPGTVGVFAASSLNTYLLHNLVHRLNPRRFTLSDGSLQQILGGAHDFLATRVSYKLNLKGPSINVHTACSGSLVAVHLARQSLLAGECDVALAGGVSIYLPQAVGYHYRDGLILSPDGHCRPFDAEAAGTVFGRGAGAIVMKRLADALASRDRVYAVIKGSAVNNDGSDKVGFTAPSVSAQAEVVAEAIANAGVDPETITYLEAHGTATAQGDPIEIAALTQAFAGVRRRRACAIGSVKGNLGHLDAAAGIAGLIKTLLALDRKRLPPTLHFTRPNPAIDFDQGPFFVNTALAPWTVPPGVPRRAGVSAFGMGGTNAHVVVEEAPAAAQPRDAAVERGAHLVTLACRSAAAVPALAARYARHLEAAPAVALGDVAFTTHVGRAQLPHRAALVARTVADARAQLAAVAAGEPAAGVVRGEARGSARPKVAWLFTGQGAQYAGMGRELYETAPVFRAALERCDAGLRGELDVPLLAVLYGEAGARIHETAYTQPALFAIEYALAELWRSWGVEPAAVLGHSIGEYVAACVAGVFDVEDALRLVAARGRLMQALPPGGAMAAALASVSDVSAALAGHREVSIAAVNAPDAVVLAGPVPALDAACAALAQQGIESQRLEVSHAFHSPLMAPMVEPFASVAAQVTYRAPQVPVVSTVTGRLAAGGDFVSAAYWAGQVRQPVQFAAAVATLADQGYDAGVEVGPHGTLTHLARRCVADGTPWFGASLRRGAEAWPSLLETLGALWVRGVPVDWEAFDRPYTRRTVALPTYPFQRQRFWVEPQSRAADFGSRRGRTDAPHSPASPLLGRPLQSPALRERVFELELTPASPSYLADHRISGAVVAPMTAFIEMALAAAAASDRPAAMLENLTIEQALLWAGDEPRTVQVLVGPEVGESATIQVFSAPSTSMSSGGPPLWSRHARMQIRRSAADRLDRPPAVDVTALTTGREIPGAEYYARLSASGLEYGPAFRGIDTVWARDGEASAKLRSPDGLLDLSAHHAHPAFLDAPLQVVYAALHEAETTGDSVLVPVSVDRLTIFGAPDAVRWSRVRLSAPVNSDRARVQADVLLLDDEGQAVLEFSAVALQPVPRRVFTRDRAPAWQDWLYGVQWERKPLAVSSPDREGHDWLPASLAFDDPAGAIDGVRREYGLETYDTLLPRLDRLCTTYVEMALRELGWTAEVGQRFTTDSLAARLGVRPVHRRMLHRMMEMLADDGYLEERADGWYVTRRPAAAAPDTEVEELLDRYGNCRVELHLLDRCGRALGSVLRGAQDPLELLFPGGSVTELEALYSRTPFAAAFNAIVRRIVAGALEHLPAERTIRVLEVGAGTGGTSAAVLPELAARRSEYTFTDVSGLFLAKARQKFAAYPFVKYRLLDIERDPAGQGFAGQTFDLVLATNVLHATAGFRNTLARVRSLLAPGGALVMVEGIGRQRWLDVIFGITEGWWKFSDVDLRSHPLLTLPQWDPLLESAGYEAVTLLPAEDRPGALCGQSIITARAPVHAPAPAERPRAAHWLVVSDRAGIGDALADALAARGDRCHVIRSDGTAAASNRAPDADAGRVAEVLRRIPAPEGEAHVVFLGALDVAATPGADGRDMIAVQQDVVGPALRLVQSLLGDEHWRTARLTLVTRGAQPVAGDPVHAVEQTSLWGFGRSLGIEHPELRCRRLDLDPAAPVAIDDLIAALLAGDGEDEIGIRNGERFAARVSSVAIPDRSTLASRDAAGPLRLGAAATGSLESLGLDPLERRAPAAGEVEIDVVAAGLNFKDVLHATGVLPGGDVRALGLECAGIVSRVGSGVHDMRVGDEVVAIARGCFATHLTTRADYVVRKPARLTFEEAATAPVAFLTAHYALVHLARLSSSDRVLIHAASGGVGMAALQLARRAGAEIFATAGSDDKRSWLRAAGVEHVFDSRSPGCADEIRRITGGRGVDVILSSASGEVSRATLAILAPHGRFIELTKTAVLDDDARARLPAGSLYQAIDVGEAFEADPAAVRPMLQELMEQVEAGALEPLPRRVYDARDAEAAFRLMAQARHIGKIVLRFAAERPAPIRSHGTYLVTGAFGGLGVLVARWLVERGAGSLVLLGRNAPGREAAAALESLRRRGAEIREVVGDIADPECLRQALHLVDSAMPPLRGIIHAAGAVDDGMLLHQRWDRFVRVMTAKIGGSWNLHQLTGERPLDFFVMFSTSVSLLGSAGQTNHAAANAFMDGLASYRRQRGLPALSINWGPWADIGAAVDLGVTERLAKQGIGAIPPEAGLDLLEALIAGADGGPQVAVIPMDWTTYLRQSPQRQAPRLSLFASDPAAAVEAAQAPAGAGTMGNVVAAVRHAPVAERSRILMEFVRGHVARSLGLTPAEPIESDRPLVELGLDSLLAVELRSTLGAALECSLPATLLFDYPTLDRLTAHLGRQALAMEPWIGGQAAPAPPDVDTPADTLSAIELMDDEEVERLLAGRLAGGAG